jgi:Uma2 family endonuclease
MVAAKLNFEQIALSDPERLWELHRGQLREKPAMSLGHNHVLAFLDHLLQRQLAWERYEVRINSGRVRQTFENYYIPDLFVIPRGLIRDWLDRATDLDVIVDPLPLVAEVRSPSTGGIDIAEKLPAYQARGDIEIWYLHPLERTLTAWRRQPDGTYTMTVFRGGIVQPIALPDVSIDLDLLFG